MDQKADFVQAVDSQLRTERSSSESGFVLAILLVAVIPVVAMAAAATITMGGRNAVLMNTVKQERVLLACESGIDEAIYAALTGALEDGVVINRDLGQGSSVTITPTFLGADLIDNDSDGDLDGADPDENVFQIIVAGKYRGEQRRVAAFLGPTVRLPAIEAAISTEVGASSISIASTAMVSGENTNLDSTRGDVTYDKVAMSIAPPLTTSTLLAQLDTTERTRLFGVGAGTASHSTGVAAAAADLTNLVTDLSQSPDYEITTASVVNISLAIGVTYRSGDVTLEGTTNGSGVLVVDGNLTLEDTARFDGVVLVSGDVTLQGSSKIFGTLLFGGSNMTLLDTAQVVLSKEAIQVAESVSSVMATLKGWQEISRK